MTSFIPIFQLPKEEYIQTNSGNLISRKCSIIKPQSVELPGGKCVILDDVDLKGDLAPIKIEKYCQIKNHTTLQPCCMVNTSSSSAKDKASMKYISLTIGAYTVIGRSCLIQSASIGLGCTIGNNCTLGEHSILKDHVHVDDNTIIPADMVIPPFAVVRGTPGQIVGFVCESAATTARDIALLRYKSFVLVE